MLPDRDEETGATRYNLWIGWVDGGVLVEAGTTTPVAGEGIIHGYWHGDPLLGEALQEARDALRASGEQPDSLVLRVRFHSNP